MRDFYHPGMPGNPPSYFLNGRWLAEGDALQEAISAGFSSEEAHAYLNLLRAEAGVY